MNAIVVFVEFHERDQFDILACVVCGCELELHDMHDFVGVFHHVDFII